MAYKRKLAVMAALVSLSPELFALAQLPLHPFSMTVKGGVNFATSGNIALDPGFTAGAGLGYRLSRSWRLEGAFDFLHNNIASHSFHQYVGLANIYYDLTGLIAYVQPYLGFGVGYGEIDSANNQFSSGGVAFAGHFGFNYQINENMSLGAGYSLIMVSQSASGTKSVYNNSILASFSYYLGG